MTRDSTGSIIAKKCKCSLSNSGNVSEWVWECYAPYSPEPAVNPKGSAECDESWALYEFHHIVRGGSWTHETVCLRAPFRDIHYHHFDILGFRLARD